MAEQRKIPRPNRAIAEALAAETRDADPPDVPRPDLYTAARKHLGARKAREQFAKQEDEYKRLLLNELADLGEEDEKGNRYFWFKDQPIETQVSGKDVVVEGVKRERRVSQSLDEQKALALIGANEDLKARCLVIRTITEIDEDALLAANFEGLITDKELQALYNEKESFALTLEKQK